jgi:hypothetical protein
MGAILAIFNFLFGWAIKAWRARGPSLATQEGEKAGALQADLASAEQGEKVEAAVAQAEVDAPKTQAGTVASLDKGTF